MDMGDSTTTTGFHPSRAKKSIESQNHDLHQIQWMYKCSHFFFSFLCMNGTWSFMVCNNYDSWSKHLYVCYINLSHTGQVASRNFKGIAVIHIASNHRTPQSRRICSDLSCFCLSRVLHHPCRRPGPLGCSRKHLNLPLQSTRFLVMIAKWYRGPRGWVSGDVTPSYTLKEVK